MRISAQFAYLALFAVAMPVLAADPLTLTEVLRRAETRVQRESARASLTRANLRYLETQSKMKWELRPQLALFSFGNPVLLASSLGLSLLGNRGQAPSPWSWQAARFDELEAEVAERQATVEAQAQAGRLFFEALARQEIQAQLTQMVESRRASIQNLERGAHRSQLTAVTRTRMESASLDIETQLLDASAAYESASIQLAAFLDMDAKESSTPLRLVESGTEVAGETAEIPNADALLQLALQRRPDLQSIRERVAVLEKQVPHGGRFRMDGVSLGFSRVGETGSNALGLGSANYLLGGNTGRSDLGFRLRLRDNGEDQALADVAAAQAQLLNIEIEKVEDSLRWEIKSLRALAVAGAEQTRLTARKLENAEKLARSIEVREQSGLESPEAKFTAEMEMLRIRTQDREAQAERKARLYHLLAVCGLGGETPAAWASLLGL